MAGAIKIWQPRYRDNTCLVARYRIPCGQDINVQIQQGARKGIYKVPNSVICESTIELMKTKTGKYIEVRAIPLAKMIRMGD